MTTTDSINAKVKDTLAPRHFELLNESHMHAGPASDSHFKLVVVSDTFNGMARVKRHQLLYKVLHDELQGPVHALALHTYTQQEWEQLNRAAPLSPACAGKNK